MRYLVFVLLFLSCCGSTTPMGVTYYGIDNTHVDIDAIQTKQIDGAWKLAEILWGPGDQTKVEVRFWGRPIQFNREALYAGATWDNSVNVYVAHGAEGCLFSPTNSGTLFHEFGHVLQFQHGIINGDTAHEDPNWAKVGHYASLLYQEFCK